MKRVLLKLAIALAAFALGVSITSISSLYSVPDVTLPAVTEVDKSASCFPGLSIRVIKSPDHREFFAGVSLSENAWSAEFRKNWYSRHTKAMNESPLAALVGEEESYRFLWLRSFHRPVAVHVWRKSVRYFMVAKRLNDRGGYEPGTIDLYWARSLSENDWNSFLIHLEYSNFWLMQTQDYTMSTDGAQWILEGYRDGRYHVVDRQSPEAGAYRDACLLLLRQSGLLAETPAVEVY